MQPFRYKGLKTFKTFWIIKIQYFQRINIKKHNKNFNYFIKKLAFFKLKFFFINVAPALFL